MLPQITVISAVYNKEAYLSASIESILGQTYADFNYIIVNDGSTDRSLALLQMYSDNRVELVNQPNRGFTATMREQLANVRTQYIAVHDTGDISYPERLRLQKKFLDEHPECSAVGSTVECAGPDGKIFGLNTFANFPISSAEQLLSLNTSYCHGSVMFRTENYHAIGGYRSELQYCQDKDLWLRLVETGSLEICREILYRRIYDYGSVSLDGNRRAQQALYSEFINQLARQRMVSGSDELASNRLAFAEFVSNLKPKDRRRIARSIVIGYEHSTFCCKYPDKFRYIKGAVTLPDIRREVSYEFFWYGIWFFLDLPLRVVRSLRRRLRERNLKTKTGNTETAFLS